LHPSTGRTVFRIDGVPCNKPPWGRLVGVDLVNGTIAWTTSTRNGTDDELGLSGYGPALSTASGLIFHAGTQRSVLRVHDADTGALITTFALPAGLHAGPITYKLQPDGKQYVVIAPGGHVGIGSKQGGYVIAYTLPEPDRDREAPGRRTLTAPTERRGSDLPIAIPAAPRDER
jgi:quinoprotein glucose dehydrogenase